MLKRILLGVTLVGITISILGACSNSENSQEGEKDEVVATINGEKLLKAEYEQEVEATKATYAQQGINVDDLDDDALDNLEKLVLEQMINTKLLRQAAENEGVSVEQNEVDSELDSIKSQFEDDSQYNDALTENNLTEDTLKEQFRDQLLITKYLENNLGELTVTEDEVKSTYEQYKEQAEGQEQEAPEFDTVKSEMEQYAISQKRDEKISQLIEDLRATNEENIEIHL